ncbi:MAG: GTP cyclohydrolase I [Polyangia bacterium]
MPHDRDAIATAVSALLRAAGHDPAHDPDLLETPARVAKLWESEFLAGYRMDPETVLGDPVLGEADPDVVVISGLRFHSMCPHHLVPFRGVAHVAYMPAGKLAGFSRVADLVECLTKRLTLQERATSQIAQAMWRGLGARGAGCIMRAEQWCLALRGERHSQSQVITAAFVGEMDRRADLKAQLHRASGEDPGPQEQE